MEDDDDEPSKDWWTKYFLSYEKLIESTKSPAPKPVEQNTAEEKRKLGIKTSKIVAKLSPKHTPKKISPPNIATCQIYPYELESQTEFNNFKEWLLSFPLYRGKKTGDSAEDENRIVGFFKVNQKR